jgi:hypothetical protein
MKKTTSATKVQGANIANSEATKVNGNVINQNATKIGKITYLVDNITGKQLQNAKVESNKLHKQELQSLSFCINQFKKHGANLVSSFKGLKFDEITPKNILPFLNESETAKQAKNDNKFTYWLVESLVIRYAKSKK